MSGYCWCGSRFYNWIKYRIEPNYKILSALRQKHPKMLYFQTYEEATKWVYDLVKNLPIKKHAKTEQLVAEIWFIRCHDSLFYWIEDLLKSKQLNISTYAEATEWIHDNILVNIQSSEDVQKYQ